MTTLNDIVDAIAGDLARYAPVNPYTDWRYAHPDLLETQQAPWLAVFAPDTDYELLDTIDDYDRKHRVVIEWAESIADSAEISGADPALVRDAIDHLEPVVAQVETYASGVPGLTNQTIATITRIERSTVKGLVFSQAIELVVEQLNA